MRHDPITADPDIAQATEDFAADVRAMRDLSRQFALATDAAERYRLTRAIQRRMGAIDLRAQRIGSTGMELFRIISDAVPQQRAAGDAAGRAFASELAHARHRIAEARVAMEAARQALDDEHARARQLATAATIYGLQVQL